jgi:cytochrome c oxidase assembly protein subunit 15
MSSSSYDVSAPRKALGRFNAAAAVFLLIAGGMVTSTNSGMAVPDWPLSYGQWLPKMTGGVFFEHGHRMVAAFIGLMVLIMAFYTQFDESRPGVRRLAWWTLLAVSVQGALGGITVWFNLPYQTSAAHATLGQTVFCLLVVMADLVSGDPAPVALDPLGRAPALALIAVAALWCQLVMGAVMRHGGSGIAPHLAGAAVAALAAGALGAAALARREPSISRPGAALLALLALQLTLGLATADFRTDPLPRANPAMIVAATAHLVIGALLLGASVLLAFRLHRMKAAKNS